MKGIDKRSLLENKNFPCVFRLRTKSDAIRNVAIDYRGCFSVTCNTDCWLSFCFEL